MENLLLKTRFLNKLIQRQSDQPADFNEMAETLSDLTETAVYIVGERGQRLGYCELPDILQPELKEGRILDNSGIRSEYIEWLSNFQDTSANYQVKGGFMTVIPIFGGRRRLGTLVLARKNQLLTESIILAEHGATVIGLEILRSLNELSEKENRKREAVAQALAVLSYSEIEAVKYIFQELEGDEGFVVAIRLADKYMLTRSVIVNALRKLESAGVIQARSLGMKGTYIKVLNEYLYEQLAKMD